MQSKVDNIKDNLVVQVKKLYRECNEKSFETRARYRDATERFCGFLAENYGLQKFANIKGKHLTAYVEHLKDKGAAASTISSDLSGIRFFHRLSGGKFELPDNKSFHLEKRQTGETNRAWSDNEISKAVKLADEMGRWDISMGIRISRQFGTRIEETCKMRVEQLLNITKYEELRVKGKGGHIRQIQIRNLEQTALLHEILAYIKTKKLQPNDYVITSNVKGGVQSQIKSIQNWLSNHSSRFIDEDRTKVTRPGYKPKSSRLTFHGLRYAFAQQYEAELKKARDPMVLRKVSLQLGHYREAVTKIYLARKA